MFDMQLSISTKAWAIANLLSDMDAEFTFGQGHEEDFDVTTHAWYNGRERGIVATVRSVTNVKQLHVAFGESSGSDDVFVEVWEAPLRFLDSTPNAECTPYKQGAKRRQFKRNGVGAAADFVERKIKSWAKQITKKVK